jgi:hypothetical protein
VSEPGRQGVAVAGGAAAGVRLPARRQDHPAGADHPSGRDHREAGRRRDEVAHRLPEGEGGAAAVQAAQQGPQHVERLVADGEDLAGFFDLGGDALGLEQRDGVVDAQRGQGGVEEAAGRAERLDDAAVVGGVGEVAARAAGHQDLDARLAVLLQQQHAPAVLGRVDRRQEARRPGPDHHHVPEGLRHAPPFPPGPASR